MTTQDIRGTVTAAINTTALAIAVRTPEGTGIVIVQTGRDEMGIYFFGSSEQAVMALTKLASQAHEGMSAPLLRLMPGCISHILCGTSNRGVRHQTAIPTDFPGINFPERIQMLRPVTAKPRTQRVRRPAPKATPAFGGTGLACA